MCFSQKVLVLIQKVPLFMKTNKTRSICVYTCTIYTYMHRIHHQIPPKYKIYLVGLPSVLYEPTKPGQYVCIHVQFTHTCTIYTTKYHQIPPNKIYLVGLPSVLYKTPGQNERSMLNQLFLLFFSVFMCFLQKVPVFIQKSMTFHENQQNQVNMCVYMYHLHIHAPHVPPNTTKI